MSELLITRQIIFALADHFFEEVHSKEISIERLLMHVSGLNEFSFPFTLVFVQQLYIRYSLLSPVVRNNSSVISLPNIISFFFVWDLESTQPLGAVKRTNTLEWHVSDKGTHPHIYNYAPRQTFLQKHAKQRFVHAHQQQAHAQWKKQKKWQIHLADNPVCHMNQVFGSNRWRNSNQR